MSWNGSENKSAAPAPKKTEKAPPSKWHGLFALVVVAVGGLAAWLVMRPAANDDAPDSAAKPSRIAEVKPDIPTNSQDEANSPEAKIAKENAPKELPPQKVGELRNGYRLLANGKLHKVHGIITNDMSRSRARSSIFKHRSENIIAGILSVRPGDTLVGTPNYNGAFTKDFFDSLQDPIVIDPKDSDEHKELKALVAEAKQSLKEAMDRGEDVEKIIMDARKDCQDLARYKQVLQKDVYEYVRKEDVTDEDIDLYVQAANKMLEDKGIAPINPGPFTKLKLKMKEGDRK